MILRNRYGILGALAAALFVAALAFASSPAQAHAGHVHPQSTAAAQPSPDTQASIVKAAAVEVMSAAWAAENSPDDTGCDDRGCCSSGPCTGCHGLVLTPVPGTAPPSLSTMVTAGHTLPPAGSETGRLRRPPKALA